MLTHIGGLLGFLATEMSFEYLAPVFAGDTISCTVTVAEKDESKRRVTATAGFVNQDGVELLRAGFGGFPFASAWHVSSGSREWSNQRNA
jgi:3-hydroxybutyryl-CoA dehydratase